MPISETPTATPAVVVLGAGRIGTALVDALRRAGVTVAGPVARDGDPFAEIAFPDAVLLCVPDADIATVAATFADDQVLGHCSGAGGLELLGSHRGFSLHPLTAVTGAGVDFTGVGAAIDASDDATRALAATLAQAVGLVPFTVGRADRVAYHAAACIASNFLVTLEAAAERVAETAGLSHELLVPLVRASVENWAALGPARALTGPVARGDVSTVVRQRAAIADRAPELLELFDTMVRATEALADTATRLTT